MNKQVGDINANEQSLVAITNVQVSDFILSG